MQIRALLGYIGIAAMFIFALSTGTHRAAAQSCTSGCTPEITCNNPPDGDVGGHHSGGTCAYNEPCTCWCSYEYCASKTCGNATIQYCGVQEACQAYANGTLSHCLNSSGC
jgi:hypothetical protein